MGRLRIKAKKPFGTRSVAPGPDIRGRAEFHEASHVVACWVFGVEIGEVVPHVERRAGFGGRDDLDGYTSHDIGTCWENAVIGLAGIVADEMVLQNMREKHGAEFRVDVAPGQVHNDVQTAGMWLTIDAGGDTEAAAERMEACELAAEELLMKHSGQVKTVMAALMERGRLTGAEVVELLGPYPEVTSETKAERVAAVEKGKALGFIRESA